MNTPISISRGDAVPCGPDTGKPYYSVFLLSGHGRFSVDLTDYEYAGDTVLFVSPYQHFMLETESGESVWELRFHGDFYCIEYHKKEVACNGLLFNNIYLTPHVPVAPEVSAELRSVFLKIETELKNADEYSDAVVKTYLQLVLALCSREKSRRIADAGQHPAAQGEVTDFQRLLEANFMRERNVAFYAGKFALSPNAFSKKIKHRFGKTPIRLIQERVILEAKKLLHLTHKPVKEIAAELNFEDEFYFSRYFKKGVGVSPQRYRSDVGISVVARKSME